ncbi:MAG: ADP-forming succinate--CoA ligase subunit beta [Candidatus Helarchaeota archaeon]
MVRLYEFEAKNILKKYGLLIPNGYKINSVKEIKEIFNKISFPIMLKAQILTGGRGKAGGIKSADSLEQAISKASEMFRTNIKDFEVKTIYVEQKLSIKSEFYIGIIVDRLNKKCVLIFSMKGGMEIEDLAKSEPDKILRISFKPYQFEKMNLKSHFRSIGFSKNTISEIIKIFQKLWTIMNDFDLDLIEINPCILSMDDKLYMADARMNIDDNSIFRHEQFLSRRNDGLSETEIQVIEKGMSYVELDGNIGIICNGAGLVMATIDAVRYYGGVPANFLDIGGGATRDRIFFALKVISSNLRIKGILINIVGGITRCDEIAYGIIEFLKEKRDIVISIRLVGTKEKEGQKILAEHRISILNTMDGAIKKIIELVS